MRQHCIFVLFLAFLILTSCSTSNDVVSSRFIQKRKFRKGYHIQNPLQFKEHAAKAEMDRAGKKKKENQIGLMTTVSTFDSAHNFESLHEEAVRSVSVQRQNLNQLEIQALHADLLGDAHSSSAHKRLDDKNKLVDRFQEKLMIQEQKDGGFMYGLFGFILFAAGVLMIFFGLEFITSSFFIGLFFIDLNSDLLFFGILLLSMGIVSAPTGLTFSIISLVDHKKKDPKKLSSREQLDLNFAIATIGAIIFLILMLFI